MMNRRGLLFFAAALPVGKACAQTATSTQGWLQKIGYEYQPKDGVLLSAEGARPAPKEFLERYGERWLRLAEWAALAPVAPPKGGPPVLTVMFIRIFDAMKSGVFAKEPEIQPPNPLILTLSGEKLGELPEGFPDDPPGHLRVTFSNWKENFPYRVDFYQEHYSALEPHPLSFALVFDKKSFVQVAIDSPT